MIPNKSTTAMPAKPKPDIAKLFQQARHKPRDPAILAMFGPAKKSDPRAVVRIIEEEFERGAAGNPVATGQASSSGHNTVKP